MKVRESLSGAQTKKFGQRNPKGYSLLPRRGKWLSRWRGLGRLTSRGGGSWPSVCPDGGDGILRLSVRVGRAGVDIFQRNGASNGRRSRPKCEESEVQVNMCAVTL